MAELATIARPYAEALFKAGASADVDTQVQALAAVAGDPALRQFADNPKVSGEQVFNVISDVVGRQGVVLSPQAQNFLHEVLGNGRLAALPEIAAQYRQLLNSRQGVADATIHSAFAMDAAQVDALVATLQGRFGGVRLNPKVEVDPELIGGVRVVVGDEVLDTSVRARLQNMKAALTA